MIRFGATWLGSLLCSTLGNSGDRVEEGAGEQVDLGEQAGALLDVIREMGECQLTPDEAYAVDILMEALRGLVGKEENNPEGETEL